MSQKKKKNIRFNLKKLNGMENVTRHMAYEFEAQTERKIWLKLHTSLNWSVFE